ncbi:MAG: hypothetical protein PHE51_12565 [Eubacteriales bacterium]|nr:hypothetical protein [Eubacteriales bacterium]
MKKLIDARDQAVIFDTSVLLAGIERQGSDPRYSFSNMKGAYLEATFNHFQYIKIHEEVWKELSEDRRDFIQSGYNNKLEIVSEGNLYGFDPQYTTIFNDIAGYDLFRYKRMQKENRGDIFTLAYAAYYGVPFVSTRDTSMLMVMQELPCLMNVSSIGFEYLLVLGCLNNQTNRELDKRLAALYKLYCYPAIKQGLIPPTFNKFMEELI